MRTKLYWIEGVHPGRLAIVPRPRGGDWLEDEVRSWRESGVDVVLSLLTSDEVVDLNVVAEEQLCRSNGIEFLSFSIPDRGVPASKDAAVELVAKLAEFIA